MSKDKVKRSGRQTCGVNLSAQHLPRGGTDMTTKCQTVFVKTFGCQMNTRDSEVIRGMLVDRGYTIVDTPEEAEIVLFNTCSVREHAEARVWGQVGMLTSRQSIVHSPQIIEKSPPEFASADLSGGDNHPNKKIIGVIGCMAQNYKDEIFRRLPGVNLVCGTGNIYDIPDLLDRIRNNRTQILAVDAPDTRPIDGCVSPIRESTLSAWVSIMEGCNNYCSYCVVPYVRGPERSRKAELIINEVKTLVGQGYKEVTLLGQNVNSYRGKSIVDSPQRKRSDFVELLREVGKTGIARIRFTTSHPKDADPLLFAVMAELPSVCEHLHLPVQSGSNRILKAMNRGYTREDYLKLVDSYRKNVPDGSIATDIIVGFPGEKEEDFRQTQELLEEVGFDSAFIFKYSPRPRTKAADYKDDVPLEVKYQRNHILLDLQRKISLRKNATLKGTTQEILVEGQGRKRGQGVGRTRTNKMTAFACKKDLPGEIMRIRIKEVTPYTLIGSLVSTENGE